MSVRLQSIARSVAALPEPATDPPPLTLDGVYRAHAGYVAAVGFRLLGREDGVDDLVQEVFLEASRSLATVREPGAIRAWLATIAVRVARRRLRTRRVRAWLGLASGPDLEQLAAPGASPEQRALLAQVYRALDGLAADLRIAWVLRHVEGEPLDLVAKLCGCSLATAKRRIAAAHAALREELGDG